MVGEGGGGVPLSTRQQEFVLYIFLDLTYVPTLVEKRQKMKGLAAELRGARLCTNVATMSVV